MRRALRALRISHQRVAMGKAAEDRRPAVDPEGSEDETLDDDDDDDDEGEDECPSTLPSLTQMPNGKRMNRARHSVSAEVYGIWNKKREFAAPVIPKTAEQDARIRSTCMNSFMFNLLAEDDLATVVLAFEEIHKKQGECFIHQGDDGDCLYLIEEGKVEVTKHFEGSDEEKFLCHMHPGDAVGELALLYNAPRAATCKAAESLTLWRLDRESFNNIVKDSARRRREMYEHFLQEVPLLDNMDPYERAKLCDALKTTEYSPGMDVIKQGEEGHTFYIIESGHCQAFKDDIVVYEYNRGDYFGELALLRNQPRAATVRTSDRVKLLSLDRRSFQRLLGPVEEILNRKAGRYEEIEAQFRLRGVVLPPKTKLCIARRKRNSSEAKGRLLQGDEDEPEVPLGRSNSGGSDGSRLTRVVAVTTGVATSAVGTLLVWSADP